MNKSVMFFAVTMIIVGALGFMAMGVLYFTGYGAFVASPDSAWLQPNTSWMGSGGMMGNNQGMNADLARNMMTSFAKTSYSSPGEKLFLTSVNRNGDIVTPASGIGRFGMMSNMMRPIACANCHGINGKGGFSFPDNKTESANIRWEALADEGFDEAKAKKAIAEGVDEKGERLSVWMPRWDISDQDLDDLIAYLKTL